MAIRTGIAAQFGIAAETTFATRAEPDHFYELVSESLKYTRKRTMAKGIRPNKLIERSQRFRTTQVDISGDVMLELQSNKYGLLLKHMLGSSTITASGLGYKHSFVVGDTYGMSLTMQVGTPDVNGTVIPREYTGCKIQGWEISTKLDSTVDIKLTVDGVNESTSGSLATASWPSATYNEVFYVDEVALTIGGTAVPTNAFTLSGTNAMKTDRYFLGSTTKREQLRNAYAGITGTVSAEFVDTTLYNLFVSDTTGSTSSIVVTGTGQLTYDTALYNKFVITIPSVLYSGDSPNVGGQDVVDQQLPFAVMDNDSAAPLTIDLYNSDSAD